MADSRAREAALGLVWSLWTELGAPGPHRRHSNIIVDPERLILATPWLARDDARLLDLAFAWCAQHSHRLSSSRLSGLLRETSDEVRSAAEQFLGELATDGIHLTRVASRPPSRPRDHRDMAVPVDRPSLLRLRVRALVGISGRADALVAMLSTPEAWVSAADLDDVGIAKRNVARVLSEFGEAGIAHTRRRGNVHEFRLANAAALGAVVAVPSHGIFPAWGPLFDWMRLADELEQLAPDRPATLRVEVARRRDALLSIAVTLGVNAPDTDSISDPHAFVAWAADVAHDLAEGHGPPFQVPAKLRAG